MKENINQNNIEYKSGVMYSWLELFLLDFKWEK